MDNISQVSITSVAFYLPQYHPVRINDASWGAGFTDWINVARAKPLFSGHFQPRLPGLLGFYDLRSSEVMVEQAQLARAHNISAFCFYYYRFGKHRLLSKPLNNWLEDPRAELSFLLCWANESWTRTWDGGDQEVIIEQEYNETMRDELSNDIVRIVRDRRYLRIGDKPLFLIYQIEKLPDGAAWIENFRETIFKKSGEEVLVGAVYSHGFRSEMMDWVDLIIQFPPHRMPRSNPRALISRERVKPFAPERGDHFEDYDEVARVALAGANAFHTLVPGVTPDWDNSPRRTREAHILVGSCPESFCRWVENAARISIAKTANGHLPAPLLFVNAWNEWAEGAMLEPSWEKGSSYLEAFKKGIIAAVREP